MCYLSESSRSDGPLLTISIPTYNRACYLDVCLMRICDEVGSLSKDYRRLVSIVVSNNKSTDNTIDVIRKYEQNIGCDFEFINNNENIGGDKNIVQCYTSAKTPYVWILGDDDVILSGGLRIVLETLVDNGDVDILYLSGYSYSDSYLDEPVKGRGGHGVVVCRDKLDFVKHTHIMLTFITALVVRSGISICNFSQLVAGSNLSQMSWVFPLIRDGNKFVIVKDRIYAAKIANSGGYGIVKVFGSNLSRIARVLLSGQPKLVESIENGAIVMWFPIYIVDLRFGRISGYSEEDVAIDLRVVYGQNWRYYFFLVPLILLPRFLVLAYFSCIRFVRKVFRIFIL